MGVESNQGIAPVPSRETCLELLASHRTPEHIIQHSLQVNKVALFIARRLNQRGHQIDLGLLEAAALLHDITKIDGLRKGQNHAQTAGRLLRSLGYDRVAEIVEQHVILKGQKHGSRITEEEILNYADKRVRHDKIVSLRDRFQDLQERYGKGIGQRAFMERLERKTRILEEKIFSSLSIDPEDILKL